MTTLALPLLRRSGRCQCGAKWQTYASESFANAVRDLFKQDHSSHRSMKPPKARRKASDRSKQRRECDELFSRCIRLRDRTCQAAGYGGFACGGPLQCAHLISRRYIGTRWNRTNAVALCSAHHVWFTHNPIAWDDWCVRRLGADGWSRLHAWAQDGTRPDLPETIAFLREEIARLEAAA